MKLTNPILITLNNVLHIKADNLEPVEVDSSCIDKLIDDVWFEKRKSRLLNEIPNAINLMDGINISELSDRIKVRNYKYKYGELVNKKFAFLLPVKEDIFIPKDAEVKTYIDNQLVHTSKPTYTITQDVLKHVRINDVDYYTIEEIEKAIRSLHYEDYHLDIIVTHVINNLKKES